MEGRLGGVAYNDSVETQLFHVYDHSTGIARSQGADGTIDDGD